MNDQPLIQEIRSLLAAGKVVPVVGAGVSKATCNHLPTWKTLLESGLEYLAARNIIGDSTRSEIMLQIKSNNLIIAADLLQEAFGFDLGEMGFWLRYQFDDSSLEIGASSLIYEVLGFAVPSLGDDKLRLFIRALRRSKPSQYRAERCFRFGGALKHPAILHLHGAYDQPASVVLSGRDYMSLGDNSAYRSVMQAVWLNYSLLFIGCSFDGMTDPDFAGLFDWASTNFGSSPSKNYALVLTKWPVLQTLEIFYSAMGESSWFPTEPPLICCRLLSKD